MYPITTQSLNFLLKELRHQHSRHSQGINESLTMMLPSMDCIMRFISWLMMSLCVTRHLINVPSLWKLLLDRDPGVYRTTTTLCFFWGINKVCSNQSFSLPQQYSICSSRASHVNTFWFKRIRPGMKHRFSADSINLIWPLFKTKKIGWM